VSGQVKGNAEALLASLNIRPEGMRMN
jgi:hypothetical protein